MAKRLLEVAWTGFDTLQAELEALPKVLVEEGNAILVASAEEARSAIDAAYASQSPGGTGNLRRGLVVKPVRGRVFAGAKLSQRAPHGWLYERGTKVRKNKAGQNRGAMKRQPTFQPIAAVYQKAALEALIARLYAHGAAQVTAA
jgi:hypothetical protein